MKHLLVIFSLIVLAGCGGSDSNSGGPIPEAGSEVPGPIVPGPGQNDTQSKQCQPVDPQSFLRQANGIWQASRPGMVSPDCWITQDSKLGSINRSFLSFDANTSSFESYSTFYGSFPHGVQACKSGSLGSGTRASDPQPIPVQLCQSKDLINDFGTNYYLLKVSERFYRLVGITTDTQQRTVLLLSTTMSTSTDIRTWEINVNMMIPHINHNDFRSVRLTE